MLYNIRKIRQENCMTQDELAKKANISRVALAVGVEEGRVKSDNDKSKNAFSEHGRNKKHR